MASPSSAAVVRARSSLSQRRTWSLNESDTDIFGDWVGGGNPGRTRVKEEEKLKLLSLARIMNLSLCFAVALLEYIVCRVQVRSEELTNQFNSIF